MQPERAPILERFRTAKQGEIAELERMTREGLMPAPQKGDRPDFVDALCNAGQPAVIAEYKRASPSRGEIRLDLEPEDVASQYAKAGAACISVLTEEAYFKGELGYLERMSAPGVPLLRKDFIFHPAQVEATAATPASALLLIVRLTPDAKRLKNLREQAESYGMHAVVEIFDEDDLETARESGARIIQVNARDLETFKTDRNACLTLIKRHPPTSGEIWIAASAMAKAEHLTAAVDSGYRAVLMGTALMEKGTPGATLQAILGALPAVREARP